MGVLSYSAFCFVVSLLALLSLSLTPLQAKNGRQYTEQHPLVYVDGWHKWPYAFIDEKGEPQGFSVEIVRRVMAQLAIPYTIRLVDQKEAHHMMQTGEADVTLGVADYYNKSYGTFGRTTLTQFTNSLLVPQCDSVGKFSIDDLHSVTDLAVVNDSRAYHYLLTHDFNPSDIVVTDNMDAYAHRRVATGQGGILWNTMMMRWWLNKNEIEGFCVIPVDIPDGNYRFIARDTALLARMDSIAGIMQRSGVLARMEDQWIYPDKKYEEPTMSYVVLCFCVVIIALLIAVLFFNIIRRYRARRKVNDVIRAMRLSLRSSGIKVWVYYPQSHTYAWMNNDGETEEEYVSFDFSKFYPEGEFNTIYDQIKRYEDHSGDAVTKELRCYTPESEGTTREERTVKVRMEPMRDEYGNIYLIIGMQYDITEEKKNESEIRILNERYNSAFELSIGGVMCFDANGVMTDINQRVLYILGIDDASKVINMQCNVVDFLRGLMGNETKVNLDEDVDMRCCTRIHLEEITEFLPFANPAQYHRKAVVYTSISHADSEVNRERRENPYRYFYCHLVSANDEEGKIVGYRLYVRDITDEVHVRRSISRLRRRSDEVRKERNKYHDYRDVLIRQAEVVMIRYELETHKLFFYNRPGNNIRPLTQLQLLALADIRDIKRVYRAFAHLDSRQSSDLQLPFRTRMRDANRHRMQFDVYMRPRFDADGNVESYFGYARNVTDLRVMRHKLALATNKAAEAEHLQQNFLRNMSYAIRQPLLLMQSSIAKYKTSSDEAVRNSMLDNIKSNTNRLITLSDDTLLLSRLEARMYHPKHDEFDFVPLFKSTIESTFAQYDRAQLALDVESPHEQFMVHSDATALRRIIHEALELSLRYTRAGHISVRYYVTRRRRLSIIIEDDGQGIPPQVQAHIFELQSTDSLSAEQGPGTTVSGLEIPICHALVKACGGTIEIESKVGEGTSIYIELPVE